MRVIHSGNLFFRNDTEPYRMLSFLPAGLSVDVGAAEGRITKRIALANPAGRVIAYEPFSGNIPHFRNYVEGLSNVELRQKAIAATAGEATLNVNSILTGEEKGWEGRKGYSSGGTLLESRSIVSETVQVTTLDAEIGEEIRLLKVDVQGLELDVLRGARKALESSRIDLIYIEYEGDRRIIKFLLDLGFMLMDSGNYIYSQKEGRPEPKTVSRWFQKGSLATGRVIATGAIEKRPLDAEGYIDWFDSFGKHALHTDLLAVRPDYVPTFLRAAAQLAT